MTNHQEIIVYSDGSCIGNGKTDAKGASAILFPNGEIEGGAYYLDPRVVRTNNKQEYYAVIKAMELVNEYDPSHTKVIHVYTDSMLLINTCTKWMESWKRNGWKKNSPGEIKNLDLIQILYKYCQERKIKWTHVKAHKKDDSFETTWNNKVDKCAYDAACIDDISGIVLENKDHVTPSITSFFKKRKTG
jgi:ribonuclease HI